MNNSKQIKVWDPLVRFFHWMLVGAFGITWVTEDEWMNLHVTAGYIILGLLLIRLFWGFFGTRYARFSDFVTSPSAALDYLLRLSRFRAKRYIGHNPAGGLMIVVLLVSLLITSISGLAAYGAEGYGPLAEWLYSYRIWDDELFEEVHEFFANLTLFLVLIHITGVVVESLIHSENLVRAMFTGFKRS